MFCVLYTCCTRVLGSLCEFVALPMTSNYDRNMPFTRQTIQLGDSGPLRLAYVCVYCCVSLCFVCVSAWVFVARDDHKIQMELPSKRTCYGSKNAESMHTEARDIRLQVSGVPAL